MTNKINLKDFIHIIRKFPLYVLYKSSLNKSNDILFEYSKKCFQLNNNFFGFYIGKNNEVITIELKDAIRNKIELGE